MIDILCATAVAVLFLSAAIFSKNKYEHLSRVQTVLECQYAKEKITKRLLKNSLERSEKIVIDNFLCHWISNEKIQCYATGINSLNFTVNSEILHYNDGEVKIIEIIVVCGNEG